MIGYRSANEKLEKESAELKERINKLQSKLSESKTNANVINNRDTTDTGIVSQLKEETEAAQHQVSKYEDFAAVLSMLSFQKRPFFLVGQPNK